MTIRLACCVPFCRRSRGDRKGDPVSLYNEYICAEHWRLVDRRYRRLLRKAVRHYRATMTKQTWRLQDWLWQRCKRQAIERAVGIA